MPRGVSARRWALNLQEFGERSEEQATQIFRKVVLDLDYKVVLGTPVDTGRARGNWYPSINVPSEAQDLDATDKSGQMALDRINTVIADLKLGQTAWLTNNLRYIVFLENGWSKQAPLGMVDVNLNAAASQYGGAISR